MAKTFVISVGGSLIVPNNINTSWLKEFKRIIEIYIKRNFRFVIICGGGFTARQYQNAAYSILPTKKDDLDWLGIHSTRLNAHLLRTIFRTHANPKIIKNPISKISFQKSIIIAAGYKPGRSTDYISVLLAKKLRIKKIINLTNINYIYNKDPKKYNNVKPIKEINWKNFRRIVGNKWSPGLNAPFDPVAAEKAQSLKIKVIIMNGNNIKNLNNFLQDKKFIGTTIK